MLTRSLLLVALLLPLAACKSREDRLRARMGDLPTPEEIMDRRDENADGRLTLAEFRDAARGDAEQTFARLDSDADSFVDLDELRAGLNALRSRAGG
jgi:Ca2+-binding EF-hand superfamily protein